MVALLAVTVEIKNIMGAYENPRFFNAPNYMAGTQAFIGTFKKGLEEGLQYGENLIADRKEYEKGIYEKGEELKQELDAAVSNSQMTKQQVQDALRSFYDEALSVDMPTKKGLGGLFAKPTERRLGKLDLIEAQNSFTDAVTGINTAFNYAYDPEIDIMENEDRGHPQFKKKKAIYDAIKNASANPNFNYADGKFDGSLEVMIDGKKQKFTTGEIQAIFSASGKEQRDIIDTKHNEMLEGVSTQVTTAINNNLEYLKYEEGDENKLIVGRKIAEKIVDERLGIMGEPSQYSKATLSFLNDEYNNHADVNENQKIDIVKKSLTFLPINVSKKLSTDEIARIANEPMDISAATYAERYDITPEEAIQLRQQILQGKTEVVKASYMQDLADKGLVNKAYIAPKETYTPPTEGAINRSQIRDYASTRAKNIANITYSAMEKTATPDAQDSFYANRNPESYSELKPGYIVGAGVKMYNNVAFDPNVEEGPDNPRIIPGLKVTDQMRENFIGKVAKIGDKGELFRINNVFVSPAGNIEFDYEESAVTETIDGEKQQTDIIDQTTPYNIYSPESMKSMYKAMLSDLGSEKSKVYGDNLYSELISGSYLTKPEQFAARKMDKWANYIINNYGYENMKKYPMFISWLSENYTNLPDNSPFANSDVLKGLGITTPPIFKSK